MRALSKTLLVALLLGAATPALAAQTAKPKAPAAVGAAPAASGITGDVRCLLTMAALATNKERQQAGQVGIYYFAGRINARAPGFDLTSAVKAQAPTMGPQQFQEEFKRCGAIVGASSQNVQAALESLRPAGAPAGASAAKPGAAPAPAPAKPGPTPAPAPATPPAAAPAPTQIPK